MASGHPLGEVMYDPTGQRQITSILKMAESNEEDTQCLKRQWYFLLNINRIPQEEQKLDHRTNC